MESETMVKRIRSKTKRTSKAKRFSKKQHITRKYVIDKLISILQSGQLLSNLAYNLKQQAGIEEGYRKRLDFWQKKWDTEKSNLPSWMKL